MKSIVVRGIISLILKPSSSSAAASAQQNTKIVFSDSKPSAKAKNEPSKKGSASNPHARYYATITFNQIVLSSSTVDTKVAKELIDVYFELFKEMLGEGKVDEEELQVVEKDGKKAHRDNKKTRKEIKGEAGFTEVEDSNSKLISAILTGVNRALPFAKMDLSDTKFVRLTLIFF
jgi:ribosome biogenesis protein MAK21